VGFPWPPLLIWGFPARVAPSPSFMGDNQGGTWGRSPLLEGPLRVFPRYGRLGLGGLVRMPHEAMVH
jgi:hypothetical protein